MKYPTYLIHFNPNHDPKNGQFTFASKYSVDVVREKEANKDYDPDLQFKMRRDFSSAYHEMGPGKNTKEYNKRIKAIEKAANTLAREEYNRKKKEDPNLRSDDYCDMAWRWIDKLCEESGMNQYAADIAHLMDLGYTAEDSEDIARWMHSSIPWGYVWDEEKQHFINPDDTEHYASDNSDYLVHFNKNHSKDNGQFINGDGDGDGIVDDHRNQGKREPQAYSREPPSGASAKALSPYTVKLITQGSKFIAKTVFSKTELGKSINGIIDSIRENSYIDDSIADTNLPAWKNRKENEFYIKTADFINNHGKEMLA